MTIKQIAEHIEALAPLTFQEKWDNSGFQVGFPDTECGKVLVCLDVTEETVDEALKLGCEMMVSHHPLLFRPLSRICGTTYQERCVLKAIRGGLSIYSAHTSLDNAPGGVNHMIAQKIGLKDIEWIEPSPDGISGSGLIGRLSEPENIESFLARIKKIFGVDCLQHSHIKEDGLISRVALCGGAGAFLAENATRAGADCFITGEIRYHDWFDPGITLVQLGHYQSERFTVSLLSDHLRKILPHNSVIETSIVTDPIDYD